MKFPKQIMSVSELIHEGFGERELRQIYETVGYPVAFKANPHLSTSPIRFDTVELEKYLKKVNSIDNAKRRSL